MIILLIALLLFGVLAFKQLSAPILASVVSIFVLVCFGMPIIPGLKELFMPNAASYVSSNFLIFFVGALFGAVYQHTGAAKSIAKWLSGLSRGKCAAGIVMLITGILTYGGISGFVVFFVSYPIAMEMFQTSGLSRRLIPAAISAGCWTWSMYGPGSPAIQNVIPMNYLGTSSLAGGAAAWICMFATLVLNFVWLEYRAGNFKKKGYGFQDDAMQTKLTAEEMKNEDDGIPLPNPIISIIPLVLILVTFNVPIFGGTTLAVETAVFLGIAFAVITQWKFNDLGATGNGWLRVLNEGAGNSVVSIMNTAIVVGFGGIVKETSGFQDLVAMLQNLDMNPLIFVMIAVGLCAGACGSASGGMGVAFTALAETFQRMGVNMADVHRIAAIASGTLDSLPHQGAQITLLGICKCTHKESYFDIFITQIVVPIIACILYIILANMGLAG